MSGWTGQPKKQTSEPLLTRVGASSPFCPAAISAKLSFQKRSENSQALLRLKEDFSTVLGRKKAESKKMLLTESIYKQTQRGQLVVLAEGKPTLLGKEDGNRGCKDKMMTFQWGNRRGAKDGQGEHRPVCTGKYRNSGSCQHSKAREKFFYTKLRLERGRCVCLLKHLCYTTVCKWPYLTESVSKLCKIHTWGFSAFFFFLIFSHLEFGKKGCYFERVGMEMKMILRTWKFDLLA